MREPTTKYGRGLALDCPEYLDYILAIEVEAKVQERERLRPYLAHILGCRVYRDGVTCDCGKPTP